MPFIEIQTRKLAGLISGARFFSVEDAAHLPCYGTTGDDGW
jgi:hypothetical protein